MEKDTYKKAIATVQDAGEKLSESFGKVEVLRFKTDKGTDAVTQLDIDTENFIEERLKSFDPSIGFAGEESGERKGDGRYWLLDPIDGTIHFIRGIPFCTTMLALVDNNEVIFTIIYNFVTKELFTAEKNGGAKLNGLPISVSNRSLAQAYISVESNLNDEENVKKYVALRKKATIMHTINCGYEYGLIASGKIEGRICNKPFGHDWDYAPGSLLVSEAGGVVANIGESKYDFANHDFLATNSVIYKELTTGDDVLFPIKTL